MGKEILNDIGSAQFLLRQLLLDNSSREQMRGSCALISLQAIGAEVHLQDLHDAHHERSMATFTYEDYLGRCGIEIANVASVEFGVLGKSLSKYLDYPRNYNRVTGNDGLVGKRAVGCFVLYLLENGGEFSDNHGFVIFNNNLLPRDFRRALKSENAHLVFDTARDGCLTAITDDKLAEEFNGKVSDGYRVSLCTLVKKSTNDR